MISFPPQTHLHVVNLVSRHVMEQAFSELGLDQAQNSGVLAVAEVGSILNKMFRLSERDEFMQPEKSTELALNWALRCFDRWGQEICNIKHYLCSMFSLLPPSHTHTHTSTLPHSVVGLDM